MASKNSDREKFKLLFGLSLGVSLICTFLILNTYDGLHKFKADMAARRFNCGPHYQEAKCFWTERDFLNKIYIFTVLGIFPPAYFLYLLMRYK